MVVDAESVCRFFGGHAEYVEVVFDVEVVDGASRVGKLGALKVDAPAVGCELC